MFGALSPPPLLVCFICFLFWLGKKMPIRLIQGTPGWRKNLATSPAPTDSRGRRLARTDGPSPRRCGCFLKWWYPTTMGFPTKNDRFGCEPVLPWWFFPPQKKTHFFIGVFPFFSPSILEKPLFFRKHPYN